MNDDYFSRLDEIDEWLFDNFGFLPGCCSSIKELQHSTARMVAEALWPKKETSLTWEDIREIVKIELSVFENTPPPRNEQKHYKEVLRRFNEYKAGRK